MSLNPFEFRAVINTKITVKAEIGLRLNPFEFRAVINTGQLQQARRIGRLNPFEFRAVINTARQPPSLLAEPVSIPLNSGQ